MSVLLKIYGSESKKITHFEKTSFKDVYYKIKFIFAKSLTVIIMMHLIPKPLFNVNKSH